MRDDDGNEIIVTKSYGNGYDAGYQAGRADALGSGVEGLLEELARYKKALTFIGRKGKPLSGGVAKRVAREALDRTGARKERREREERPINRERRNHMWREGRTVEPPPGAQEP